MEDLIKKAEKLLEDFKGNNYSFGSGCLEETGELAAGIGKTAIFVISDSNWADKIRNRVKKSLEKNSIRILEEVNSSRPNTPKEDVYALQDEIEKYNPEMIIVAGGGSAIDCAKAATVLSSISPGVQDIEPFFGTGNVTAAIKEKNIQLKPVFAIQLSASSAAHLTKYSNITDLKTGQKKLIVDEAIVPAVSLFDYSVTLSMPEDLTVDGAADGISHALEVYMGAGKSGFEKKEEVALLSMELAIKTLPGLLKDLRNLKLREALGLSTDLGGYAIMLGGTNGAHLTSFSLVDILPHGRACAILNPYYLMFFAPAIERQLKKLAVILSDYMHDDAFSGTGTGKLSAIEMGKAVAGGIINFYKAIGLPATLKEVRGFTDNHIEKAIEAAKNPQLEMKLKNMPVPLDGSMVETYMRPVLQAAKTGDLSLIKYLD